MEWTAREEDGLSVGEGWLWTDEEDNQHPCPRVHSLCGFLLYGMGCSNHLGA